MTESNLENCPKGTFPESWETVEKVVLRVARRLSESDKTRINTDEKLAGTTRLELATSTVTGCTANVAERSGMEQDLR